MRYINLLRFFSFCVFLQISTLNIFAEDIESVEQNNEATEKRVNVEYELDAYYSNISLHINLTDKPISDAGEKEELTIYKDLLFSSYVPQYHILEAAVFPMPELGIYLKDNARNFYGDSEISENLNLVKAITAGFEEPYAISGFLGNVVSFTRPGEARKHGNFGYMGYLVSIGDYHIKDNELIRDTWYEVEWKIKGDRKFSTHILHWSFRVGGKMHSHPDIMDVIYISLRRSRLDFEESESWFNNSGFEYTFDMDSETLAQVRHYLTVDKKWPWKDHKMGFSLALGFVWEGARKYTGDLRDENRDDFQIIIRPNIVF